MPDTPAPFQAEIERAHQLRANCPLVLTMAEVALILTIGKRTVHALVASRELRVKRIGRRVLILRSDLEKFIGSKLTE